MCSVGSAHRQPAAVGRARPTSLAGRSSRKTFQGLSTHQTHGIWPRDPDSLCVGWASPTDSPPRWAEPALRAWLAVRPESHSKGLARRMSLRLSKSTTPDRRNGSATGHSCSSSVRGTRRLKHRPAAGAPEADQPRARGMRFQFWCSTFALPAPVTRRESSGRRPASSTY
jgi:hypothetical protein